MTMTLISPAESWHGRPQGYRPKRDRPPAHSGAPRRLCRDNFTRDGATARTVNFYNWSIYIAPGVLDDFTNETGIKVVYDTFDANETLETQLLAGKSGYDVVVPTAYFLQRQIKASMFPEARQGKTAESCQCLAGRGPACPPTIRTTNTPPTTCGARPASAITSRCRDHPRPRRGDR